MILSDNAIIHLVRAGKMEIDPPLDEEHVRPVGIRLHLASEILIPQPGQIVDPTVPMEIQYERREIPEDGFLLHPGSFVLGSTCERIRLPNTIVGHLEGRSTIARLGLAIHCTSGIIDGMHDDMRCIVLEMINHGVFTIVLKPKMPIGMLILSKMTCPVVQRSQEQYRDQLSTVAPNLHFQPKKLL